MGKKKGFSLKDLGWNPGAYVKTKDTQTRKKDSGCAYNVGPGERELE